MNRLGEFLDRQEPTMAVTITRHTSPENTKSILGLEIDPVAEIRADTYYSHDVGFFVRTAGMFRSLPTLLTIRSAEENGGWNDTESKRLDLYTKLIPHYDGVDVEIASSILPEVIGVAHNLGKVVIASSHDFGGTPPAQRLEDLHGQAQATGADYTKIAASAKTGAEYRRLKTFTKNNQNVIVVAMDRYGLLSRIALPGLGSHLTYASSSSSELVAQGQMNYEDTDLRLRKVYPGYAELANSNE
ncbi:MAG TPA: type I 3-dehydroquinate dehydratase [Patescibacteria group bacterium]|nr:type I 3-dehydroquinate dehydratase [Patescibacteria group bacterium]